MIKKTVNIIKKEGKTVLTIYAIALFLTFILLKLPDVLKESCLLLFDFKIPLFWNGGIALIIATIIGYRFSKTKRETTLLGTNKVKSITFTLIILTIYSFVGISNNYEINEHLWAFIFVSLTLIYDIFEESFWRGYLNDFFKPKKVLIKYIVTGALWAFWHFLIFENFSQFGGFHYYLIISIILSIIIGFVTDKTNSILVASALHALLINKNIYVTLTCFIILGIMIFTWKKTTANNSYK